MSGGPRAGDCGDASLEKYLIPTITVPPTNRKDGVSPRIARVIPADSNRQSGVDVRLEGLLRLNANTITVPSLSLKAVDLGSTPNQFSFSQRVTDFIASSGAKGYIGTRGNADIFIEIAKKRAGKAGINNFARVPRYGVKRANYQLTTTTTLSDIDYIGVTTNFEAWPESAAQNEIPAAYDSTPGTWTVFGQPRLIESSDGKMYLFHIAKKAASSDYDLVCSRFDPTQEASFAQLTSVYSTTGQFVSDVLRMDDVIGTPGTEGSSGFPLGIAPVLFGDDVFVVMCLASPKQGAGVGGLGYLATFQLSGDQLSPLSSSSSASTTRYAKVVPLPEVFDVTDDVSGGSDIIAPDQRFGGIDAVDIGGRVRVAVGLKCPGFCSLDTNHTVAYLETTDFNTWGDSDQGETEFIGPIPRVTAIGSFAKTADVQINDIARVSETVLYGCGPNGTVYRTEDGGQSWVKLKTNIEPENLKDAGAIDLYAIVARPVGVAGDVIYAGGSGGTLIRSEDSGSTWRVMRSSLPASTFIVPPASTGLPTNQSFYSGSGNVQISNAIRGIAVKTAPTASTASVWICGSGGFVEHSPDGGVTWNTIVRWRSSATNRTGNYYSIINYSGNDILVGGDGEVHNTTAIRTSDQKKRVLRIANATTEKVHSVASPNADLTFHGDVSLPPNAIYGPGGDGIVRFRNYGADTIVIAIDASGHIYKTASDGTGFSYSHRPAMGYSGITRDIFTDDRYVTESLSATQAFVLEEDSGGNTTVWSAVAFDLLILNTSSTTSTDSYRQIGVQLKNPRAISMFDQDKGVVVGASGSWANGTRLAPRVRPRMLRLPNSKVMLVMQNLASGRIEHWEFDNNNDPPLLKGFVTNEVVDNVYDPADGISPIFRMPSLAIDEFDVVHLGWGSLVVNGSIPDRVMASLPSDNWQSWVPATTTSLALPMGFIRAQSTVYTRTSIAATRDMEVFSRGRVFTTVAKADRSAIGVFAARDFKAATEDNPTNFMPIIPGAYQWTGINDHLVRFSGFPASGDTFEATPAWAYQATNVVVESPSVVWRSASSNSAVPINDLIWDRRNSDVEAIIGSGNTWDISAAALFGTNFDEFSIGVSQTNEEDSYTEQSVVQSLQSGTATGPGGGAISSVVIDSSAQMVPSMYKLGAGRTFYLRVTSGTNSGRAYRILDNTRTSILLQNASTLGTTFTYRIFGDRVFADLTPSLTDAIKYNARYVRVRVKSQRTWEGYFKIGTAILGNYVSYAPHTGNESRRRFSEGFGWRPVPSSVLQRGDSGVSSIEHIGFQRAWTLPYDQIQWWDRDMQMNGLMPAMRQAFAIMFNGNDTESAPHSLYLVRLNDGPETTNTYQDRYSYTMQLEEVV